MVLLARDFLLGASVPALSIVMVLLSTSLYAAAAVAVAAGIFGQESVVFADAGSFKSIFARELIKPAPRPSVSMALLIVAIMFPVWFFVQSSLSPGPGQSVDDLLVGTARLMPPLFVVLPLALILYWKVDVRETFALHLPQARYVAAAVLIGATAWIPSEEVNVLQAGLAGVPEAMLKNFELVQRAVENMTLGKAVLVLAVVPALCEELFFRGLLLSGLSSGARKWTAILVSATIFGVFHFILFRFPVTAGLGVVLALLCWNARSILPAMIAHLLHNGIGAYTALHPQWRGALGIDDGEAFSHLPIAVILIGGMLFAAGVILTLRPAKNGDECRDVVPEEFLIHQTKNEPGTSA